MIYTDKLVYLLGWIFIQQGLAQAAIYACNATAPCGCSTNDVNINARIVGGEVAAAHSLGWSVSLRVSQTRHFCGGSILSPHYILTAAHCLEDLTSSYGRITVAVGSDRLNDNEGQRLAVSKIYLHPRWNTVTKENDIALIKLSKAINIRNPNSARLCLPPMGELNGTEFPVNQSSMVAIGWGSTQSGGSVTNELRQVTLFAVDKAASKCRNIVYNTDVQFCAAVEGGGKDTCQGDSGGPLMSFSDEHDQWMIAGITSYGRGCGLSNSAGVYTRVTVYFDWIKSIVGHDGMLMVGENSAEMRALPMGLLLASLLISMRK